MQKSTSFTKIGKLRYCSKSLAISPKKVISAVAQDTTQAQNTYTTTAKTTVKQFGNEPSISHDPIRFVPHQLNKSFHLSNYVHKISQHLMQHLSSIT